MRPKRGHAAKAGSGGDRAIPLADQLAAAESLAGLGIWSWAPGAAGIDCSAGLAHLLGLGAERTIGLRALLRRVAGKQRKNLYFALRSTPDGPIELNVADSKNNSRSSLRTVIHRDATRWWGAVHDITALRKVSSELDQTEHRWEAALESAGQAAWDSNLVTGEVYHSRAWRVLRGMHPDGDVEDTHEQWIARVHPDDIDRIQAIIAKEHTGEVRTVAFEYRERMPDGSYKWISSLGKPVEWNEQGLPTRIVGTDTDITQRKQDEAEMRRLSSRLELALESAGQGAWDSDLEAGTLDHSTTWRRIRGLNPDGDPRDTREEWLKRLHPDDLDFVLGEIEKHKSGAEQKFAIEYRERHVEGNWVWISSLGRAVEWFEDGRPKRIVGTDTDITQRKLAEAENARLKRRLELALEVSKLGIFEANLETREVMWDKRVREIYGVPVGEIAPDYWEHSLHPDDYEMAMKRVWNAVENQSSYNSDFRVIRPDGDVRNIHTEGTWYVDVDGVPKMLGVNWDVTAEVAAKADLERARELAEARNAELEAAKARIEYNAMHDALTGLPNRRFLDQKLSEMAKYARDVGGALSLLHIDLDLFKQINDTLGHGAGDAMLIHVANLLRECVGPEAFVARVGGDEFSIICPVAAGETQLTALADEIIARVRRPVPYEGHFCRFGASIGIASCAGRDANPERLLIDADIALYRAKGRGKNRFEVFTEALQAETVNTKRVADDILVGIEQDAFFPHFQPLFDAQTMELVGVEALARWNHPTRGVLPPSEFLRIAEDLNVVTNIDRVILEKALQNFARWRVEGLPVPAVSVNVSFRRLHDQQLLAHLRELKFAPGTLAFELLESIFLDELDDLVSWNIDQIREMGIDINIDDFGTGHASIISLLRLRPNRFKLDRAFLAGLTTSTAQRRLVRSIVDIGKSLGIKVVAEGVETMDQAQVLRELGCDVLQGFAFARPMPAAAFEAFMREHRLKRAS